MNAAATPVLRDPEPGVAAAGRDWEHWALRELEREAGRSADTHLLRLDLPAFRGVRLYLKDETTHPTGSLKHRLARSLFLYALCNGRLSQGRAVVDASSGSTAISEAWFARLLGLPFVAVMPDCTAQAKIDAVRAFGGRCALLAAGSDCAAEARALAQREAACFLDQFGLAERATDWRGNNNIAESLLAQMARQDEPEPEWIVCGAGTGGTSATIGRYLRYRRLRSRLCVAEPTGCAFARGWQRRDTGAVATASTLLEGIGRQRVEPGFVFDVVDHVEEVDDPDSIAGAWLLADLLGRRFGGSSGTTFVAAVRLAARMHASGADGSVVAVLGDGGERYADTLFDRGWLAGRGIVQATVGAVARLRRRCNGDVSGTHAAP